MDYEMLGDKNTFLVAMAIILLPTLIGRIPHQLQKQYKRLK